MGDFREASGPVGLASATDVEAVARQTLHELLMIDGVRRAGLALVEGGGRRLRFLSASVDETATAWCHIDAFDDVPLTRVVRTGETIAGELALFEDRYAGLVAVQREAGTRALVAVPLPGVAAAPIGGTVVYLAVPQVRDADLERVHAVARHAADAVRRVRARAVRGGGEDAPAAHPRRATMALADDPRAAGVARRFLRATLASWGIDGELAETAELCVSELVTNAVIHAGASSEVRVAHDVGRLTVSVRDHGGPGEGEAGSVGHEDPLRVFGRGLVLVEALSDRWGAERDDVGTTSWFELEVADDAVRTAG